MEDLQKIKENVKILLTRFPKLRSPYQRKQFHVMYWRSEERREGKECRSRW